MKAICPIFFISLYIFKADLLLIKLLARQSFLMLCVCFFFSDVFKSLWHWLVEKPRQSGFPVHCCKAFAVCWPSCLASSRPAGPTQWVCNTRWREGRQTQLESFRRGASKQPEEEKDGAGPVGQEPSSELLPQFRQNKITNENSREPRTSWRQRGVSFGVGAVRQGRLWWDVQKSGLPWTAATQAPGRERCRKPSELSHLPQPRAREEDWGDKNTSRSSSCLLVF